MTRKNNLDGLRLGRPTVRNLRTGPCRAHGEHLTPANDPVLYARCVEHFTRAPWYVRLWRAIRGTK